MARTSTTAPPAELAEPEPKQVVQAQSMELPLSWGSLKPSGMDMEEAETVSNSSACTGSTPSSAGFFSPVVQHCLIPHGCMVQEPAFELAPCAPVCAGMQLIVVSPEMHFQPFQQVPVMQPAPLMMPAPAPVVDVPPSPTRSPPSTSRGPIFRPEHYAQLESDLGPDTTEQQRASAMAALRGRALQLAHDSRGCRLLQLAFQAHPRLAGELLGELAGHVRELIKSPHGNYVIQKVPEDMPSSYSDFIVRELLGFVDNFARHRYGCRVLSRLLEHSDCSFDDAREQLMEQLLDRAEEWVRHQFAHHVMEKVLEHGTPAQKDRVLRALLSDPARNAQDRFASFVIEKALVSLEGEDAFDLASQVLTALEGSDSCVLLLGQTRGGARLAQSLASVSGLEDTVVDSLEFHIPTLSQNRYGKHLLEKVGLMEAARPPAAGM